MTKNDNEILKYSLLIGAVYFLVVKPILLKLGVTKTAQEQKASEAIIKEDLSSNLDSPFSGAPYLNKFPKGTNYTTLTGASARSLSSSIRSSMTNFGDNEQRVIGIFKQLKSKAQVAVLSKEFFNTYNLDLWTFLKEGTPNSDLISQFYTGLSEKDLGIILNIVDKLPKYK
jgi:hypothetical protein